jgi:hypothetical protein
VALRVPPNFKSASTTGTRLLTVCKNQAPPCAAHLLMFSCIDGAGLGQKTAGFRYARIRSCSRRELQISRS